MLLNVKVVIVSVLLFPGGSADIIAHGIKAQKAPSKVGQQSAVDSALARQTKGGGQQQEAFAIRKFHENQAAASRDGIQQYQVLTRAKSTGFTAQKETNSNARHQRNLRDMAHIAQLSRTQVSSAMERRATGSASLLRFRPRTSVGETGPPSFSFEFSFSGGIVDDEFDETALPSMEPTFLPTDVPMIEPTAFPTVGSMMRPTAEPTSALPGPKAPTAGVITEVPTAAPIASPTLVPTSFQVSLSPTAPSQTLGPSQSPTQLATAPPFTRPSPSPTSRGYSIVIKFDTALSLGGYTSPNITDEEADAVRRSMARVINVPVEMITSTGYAASLKEVELERLRGSVTPPRIVLLSTVPMADDTSRNANPEIQYDPDVSLRPKQSSRRSNDAVDTIPADATGLVGPILRHTRSHYVTTTSATATSTATSSSTGAPSIAQNTAHDLQASNISTTEVRYIATFGSTIEIPMQTADLSNVTELYLGLISLMSGAVDSGGLLNELLTTALELGVVWPEDLVVEGLFIGAFTLLNPPADAVDDDDDDASDTGDKDKGGGEGTSVHSRDALDDEVIAGVIIGAVLGGGFIIAILVLGVILFFCRADSEAEAASFDIDMDKVYKSAELITQCNASAVRITAPLGVHSTAIHEVHSCVESETVEGVGSESLPLHDRFARNFSIYSCSVGPAAASDAAFSGGDSSAVIGGGGDVIGVDAAGEGTLPTEDHHHNHNDHHYHHYSRFHSYESTVEDDDQSEGGVTQVVILEHDDEQSERCRRHRSVLQ